MNLTSPITTTTTHYRSECMNCGQSVECLHFDSDSGTTTSHPCGCANPGVRFVPTEAP